MCVLLGTDSAVGNKTEYVVTNQVVRSVTEVARYTKVWIRYDMISGKL